MNKNLVSFILAVVILVGAAIGSTVFVTKQINEILDNIGTFTEHMDNATARFDKIISAFEENKVTGITRRVVNTNNLVKKDGYTFINGINSAGIKATYDDDGVITINGKVNMPVNLTLGERVILEKGYYTICVQAEAPARSNCSIVLKTENAEGAIVDLVRTTFATPLTFYSDGLQYISIIMNVGYGESFNNYEIMPVIVSGEKMQSFFVEESVPLQ